MGLRSFFQAICDITGTVIRAPRKGRLVYTEDSAAGDIHILATGPSFKDLLSKHGVSYFKDKTCFALNDFAFTEYFNQIQPRFYIIVDPAYWYDKDKANSRDVEYREKTYNALVKATWHIDLIVPTYAVKKKWFVDLMNQNPNISISTIFIRELWSLDNKRLINYCWRYNFAASAQNVLIPAIIVSINKGFKNIFLYGTDHSWTQDMRVNEKNELCTVKKHFFDEKEELVPWLNSSGKQIKMAQIMKFFYCTFKAYDNLSSYAIQMRCNIYNTCKNSFIDSFPKIEI